MVEIDDVDTSILEVLKENSRFTVREIAKRTGVPLATVNRRIRKLVDNGVIDKFTIALNNEKLGKKTVAYILIRTHPGADYSEVRDKCLKNGAVEDIQATTGQFDIIMKIRVTDNDELSKFLTLLRSFPSLAHTETLIALNLEK